MSTRDADNDPVPHDEFGFPDARSPGQHLQPALPRSTCSTGPRSRSTAAWTASTFDEVNAGFSGGQKYGFNGNEGFDDYTIADFNRYLLAKYPGLHGGRLEVPLRDDRRQPRPRATCPPATWPATSTTATYLRANGWNLDPLNAANPLAAEWGRVTANRMYADDTSFTATYLRRYWKEMVDELRAYAWRTAHRQILISSNGLLPVRRLQQRRHVPVEPRRADPRLSAAPTTCRWSTGT